MFLTRLFKPKKRTRIWLFLTLVFLIAFFAANFNYPNYWNRSANWANVILEKADVPNSIEKYDKWGVFKYIDSKARIPNFVVKDYSLGLDLQGGIHLVYEADLSNTLPQDRTEAMASLRDAIERRVNFLGVSEPVVQIKKGNDYYRLIVELAGIDDPNEAIKEIGETPFLEFREYRPKEEQIAIFTQAFPPDITQGIDNFRADQFCDFPNTQTILIITQITGQDPCFIPSKLTGQYLERASVTTDQTTGLIQIAIQFDKEGAELFEALTERNLDSVIAIYLDEIPLSLPRVNQKIIGGQAVITGSFTVESARDLARNLNAGALPVPINLISQQRVGATLGEQSLNDSLKAGMIALIIVFIFLIAVYRFSGLLAVASLIMYLIFLVALIKLIPITLTLAGIAGLILSIGLAVDANILIFERLKEELSGERESIAMAIDIAFDRAWPSIRDGNISTLLTAAILFWFSTSFVKGFALTLGIGILVSLFSSMIITKYFMKLFVDGKLNSYKFIWIR